MDKQKTYIKVLHLIPDPKLVLFWYNISTPGIKLVRHTEYGYTRYINLVLVLVQYDKPNTECTHRYSEP